MFAKWLGDKDAQSRVVVRNYVKQKGYRSLLDIPSGLSIDYHSLKQDNTNIQYFGIDITDSLVKKARDKGINVQQGSIEKIPMEDASVDICYARHILEHLSYYEKALKELVRVAKKEVLVVFFIKPTKKDDVIDLAWVSFNQCYHNYYNQKRLEDYVTSLEGVDHFTWENVNKDENILHIYLNKAN